MTSVLEERYRRVTGLTRRQLAALVATVVAYETDGYPVWRGFVTEAVARAGEILTAGDGLLDLARMGLLFECGKLENDLLYRPTRRGLARVRAWIEDGAMQGAAE